MYTAIVRLASLAIALTILPTLALAASPKTLTTSVAFTDPANNVLANGSVVLTLNQGANVIGGGQLVQGLTVTLTLNSSGLISGSPTIWANDQLQPTGTVYIVNIYNSNGLKVRGPENWIISGASPIDLSLETNVNLPDPGLGQPVLQNPSAAQTITGQSLTLTSSAPLSFDTAILTNKFQVFPTGGSAVTLCSATMPVVSAGFNVGTVTTNTGTCSFAVTVGTGSAGNTGSLTLPTTGSAWNCFAFNVTHPGAIIMTTSNGTTSATLTNYGTTPGTPVNWTNSDIIDVSCFGH